MAGRRNNGEGSVALRKDGRWIAVITLPTGKKKGFYGKTRPEAVAKMKQALRDLDAGLVVDPKKISLADFLNTWLEDTVRVTTRVTTYENYKCLTNTHIIPGLGYVQLQKLTPQQIQHFLNEKLAAGLSTRSVHYLLVLLRRSLGLAVKWGMVQKNVALLAEPPRVVSKEVVPFTIEQAKQFLGAVQGDKLEALYTVVLAVGLRRGEVLALRWDDVDLENCTIAIRGSLQRVQGKLQILETKTQKSKRTVVVPRFAIQALREHRTRQLEQRLSMGQHWHDNGLVFTTFFGGMYCPRRLDRQFEEALKRAGLPKIRFHDLRHSAATLLLSQGVPIKVISEILGHSNTRMTLEVYSHVLDPMRAAAATQMERLLGTAG